MVQTTGKTGEIFQLFIKSDGAALKRSYVGITFASVEAPRRMLGCAGSKVGPFDQHNIGPSEFVQVI